MKIYLLIIIVALFYSCSNSMKMETEFENGKVMEEFYVLKSDKETKNGLYKRYDDKNNLVEQANYENGQLNGTRKLFYPTGVVEIEENYVMSSFEGDYVSYYPSGNISSKGKFENNIMVEPWYYYYDLPNEAVKEIINYNEDNVEEGPYKEFYENGQLSAEGIYKTFEDLGPLDNGAFKSYYEDGQLEMQGFYKKGRKNGVFKMYSKEGELVEEIEYENGIIK